MRFVTAIVIFFSLSIASCKKWGCMDKTALNYDPKAKTGDEGACFYLADSLIGNYSGPDTLYAIGPGDTAFQYHYGTLGFSISRLSFDLVSVNSAFVGLYYREWHIDSIPFSIIDFQSYRPDTMYGTFNLKKDTLFYHVILSNDTLVQRRWGYGVKQ